MGKQLICCFYIVFSACVSSCSTKRAITSTHEENAVEAKIDGNLSIFHNSNLKELSITDIINRNIGMRNIKFRIYDTEKSPDSLGNRPLLMEGEILENTEDETTVSNTLALENIVEDSVSSHIEEQMNNRNERDEFNYTKKDKPAWYSLAILVCVIFLVSFAYKIYKR